MEDVLKGGVLCFLLIGGLLLAGCGFVVIAGTLHELWSARGNKSEGGENQR